MKEPSGREPEIRDAIARCQEGEIDALEPIYREFKQLVFRICYRFARDQGEAADWTQDVFIRVFEKIGSFRAESNFTTWLYRVATNYCLDQLKRGSREEMPLETPRQPTGTEDPTGRLIREERRTMLHKALDELDPRLKAVVILKHLEQLSYSEISRILDIPQGTVGSRLHQARKELVERLRHLWPRAVK